MHRASRLLSRIASHVPLWDINRRPVHRIDLAVAFGLGEDPRARGLDTRALVGKSDGARGTRALVGMRALVGTSDGADSDCIAANDARLLARAARLRAGCAARGSYEKDDVAGRPYGMVFFSRGQMRPRAGRGAVRRSANVSAKR